MKPAAGQPRRNEDGRECMKVGTYIFFRSNMPTVYSGHVEVMYHRREICAPFTSQFRFRFHAVWFESNSAPPLAAGQFCHIPFVCLFFGDFGFYKRENIHRISKYACISKLSFRISPCKKQNHTIRRKTCCFSDPHLPIFILPPSCPQLGYFLDTHDPLVVLPPPPGYVDISRIQAKRYDAQAPR